MMGGLRIDASGSFIPSSNRRVGINKLDGRHTGPKEREMKTTLNALGGFILATIIAVLLCGNLNPMSLASGNVASLSEATHWTLLFAIVTACGLRGIARQ